MVKMSQGTKERLSLVINAAQFVFRWGFIPTILYLGYRKGSDAGMPPLTLMNVKPIPSSCNRHEMTTQQIGLRAHYLCLMLHIPSLMEVKKYYLRTFHDLTVEHYKAYQVDKRTFHHIQVSAVDPCRNCLTCTPLQKLHRFT